MSAPGEDAGDGDATSTGRFAADLPPGTILAGRFRLDRLLGIGGMGVVYRATDLQLGVPVAIKLLRSEMAERPGAFERFRQELLLSRQVSSPHVVRIHDIAQHEDRWLISMDLVEGEPLDKLLDREGRMPVERALAIARQVALGLAAAHARNVVHRDLKPSNVLLGPDGNAYISDFGIARSLGTRGLTITGTVVGTPDYLSPEQARAEPVDARSDLYALGLLLYEMLSGEPAYSGGTQTESITQRLVGPPPPIRRKRADVPAWVERLLDRLLRSNPAHRPRDAEAVVHAIDARHVSRDWRPGRRALGLALALAVLGVGGWFAWQRAPLTALPVFAAAPERLVLLPMENATGDPALAPATAALSEHLRQSLAAAGGLPVVDGERVEQALAQIGLPDRPAGAIDTHALLKALPATRLLRPRLVRAGSGFAVEASLGPGAEPPMRGQSATDALAATRAFIPVAARALAADAPSPASTLPASLPALLSYGEGLAQRRAGRLEAAIVQFDSAARTDPGYAAAWLAQAQARLQAGMVGPAAEAAAQGRTRASAKALLGGFAQVEALSGGEPGAAIAALQARLKSRPDDLDAQLRLAQLQGQSNALPAAIANLRALLRRDESDPRAWFLLGKYSIMHGEISSAIDESLVRALVLYKRGRNAYGQAETVNALGVAYSRLGQSDDAREQFGKAVELRRALGDRRGVASSLRNLAQLSTVQGRFDEAKAQLDEARTLFAAIGDADGLAAVDNELGLLAEERGDFAGAESAFRRVLRAREASGDDYGVAESLNNLGFAQFALGDYDSAAAFWRQSLEGFRRVQDSEGSLRAQQNLGALETARGNWKEARDLLDASLREAERAQMLEETAVSRFYMAQLDLAEGRVGEALAAAQRAGALFAERKDQRGSIDVLLLRTQALLAVDAVPEATQALTAGAALLAGATAEQRAGAALLRAGLARRAGDLSGERDALAAAAKDAAGSGLQVLRLRVAIARNEATPAGLDEDSRRLGNLPVRLEWLERELQRRLEEGHAREAVAGYQLAQDALRGHDQALHSASLHRLGARALALSGDPQGAQAARARSATAQARVAATLPPSLRTGYLAAQRAAELADEH